MEFNPLFLTDFYKTSHKAQFPRGTELIYSNFTCRADKNFKGLPNFDHKIVFFGLQGVCQWLLKDYWHEHFFSRDVEDVVGEYEAMLKNCLGIAKPDSYHIRELHAVGYLPIEIKALPEGSRVNIRIPVYTIRNTHPRFFWLTNYLETQLSAELWKAITSATTAFEYRRLFERYAGITGGNKDFIDFQGHDFSMRGMSGVQDATSSGAGHLLSFKGTDTISAIAYINAYYRFDKGNIDSLYSGIGYSVPATEHAVVCAGGQDNEFETFRRLIEDVYPNGIVSLVSDTWDFWQVVTEYMKTLKPKVMARDGKVVIRPDSGDPVKIVVGDPDAPKDSPEYKGAVECLWDIYGGVTNDLGYRTLDSHIGLIYGDSISLDRAERILEGLKNKRFASDNIVFGIGSYTYNFVTRDTFGTAIKATYSEVHGEGHNLSKNPKTDDGTKKSAAGLIRVEKEGSNFVLYDKQSWEQERKGELKTVFRNGVVMNYQNLEEIKKRLSESHNQEEY